MALRQKIISNSGEAMLTAREAASRLSCAPDYIGKLCRDGKLECVRTDNAWYVDSQSIFEFEKEREVAKALRAQALAKERKEENAQHKGAQTRPSNPGLRAALLAAGASLALGALFVTGTFALRSGALIGSEQSAALAQIDSPFFSTGSGPEASVAADGSIVAKAAAYVHELFSSDVRLQLSVRKPSPDLSAATTTLADAFAPPQPASAATSSPQIVINPIVQHTIERVVVENGISPAMLSSIVKELAQGSDGSIQYSKGGTLAASSTALSWDNQLGQLTVAGAVRTDQLCLEDVCLSKDQLAQLLAASSSATTTTP